MKYAVILFDGMADYPVPALDGKTPMEIAKKPNVDYLAAHGRVGLVKTVPDGFKPGSDVANLGVLGYDVRECYTGRSPLEAVSIGVELNDTDVTLRCNLVTLSDEENYDDKTMIDYSAGDISTEEAAGLIAYVQENFGNDEFKFYSGVSYRHCLVWKQGTTQLGTMTPPHDISDKVVGPHISDSENAKKLTEMMRRSYALLKEHPINIERIKQGKRPANSIWLWGEGTKPRLSSFKETYGLEGSIISAVDLLRGIGGCAKMTTPIVEGVTGYLDTNFEGKAQAAIDQLENGCDFVYVHVEAPDECGHRNEPENKVKAIELIDEKIVAPILKYLQKYEDYSVMVLPDHPTPIVTKTHAGDPVPFVIYRRSRHGDSGVASVNEGSAKQTGVYYDSGRALFEAFLDK